jgi:hypothetical protein
LIITSNQPSIRTSCGNKIAIVFRILLFKICDVIQSKPLLGPTLTPTYAMEKSCKARLRVALTCNEVEL